MYISANTFKENGQLLWENPNPSADFGAQTLDIDFSEYDFAMVTGVQPNGMSCTAIVPIPGSALLSFAWVSGSQFYSPSRAIRAIITTAASIQFGNGNDCYISNGNVTITENVKTLIPQKIYGIKI